MEAAERAVAEAFRVDPNYRRAVYVSAFLLRARGRHRRWLAAFQQVISLNPEATDRMIAESFAQSGVYSSGSDQTIAEGPSACEAATRVGIPGYRRSVRALVINEDSRAAAGTCWDNQHDGPAIT